MVFTVSTWQVLGSKRATRQTCSRRVQRHQGGPARAGLSYPRRFRNSMVRISCIYTLYNIYIYMIYYYYGKNIIYIYICIYIWSTFTMVRISYIWFWACIMELRYLSKSYIVVSWCLVGCSLCHFVAGQRMPHKPTVCQWCRCQQGDVDLCWRCCGCISK